MIVERVVVSRDGNVVSLKLRPPFAYLQQIRVQVSQELVTKKEEAGNFTGSFSQKMCSDSVQMCWGTWIRTRINGSRNHCSAVELSPNGYVL